MKRCCMSRPPFWWRKEYVQPGPRGGLFVRGSSQYGVEASGSYDLLWEVFFIPVQRKGLRRIWGLGEMFGVGGNIVGKNRYRRCYESP